MNNRPLAALSVARRNIMPKIPCKHYVIASILLCAVAFTNAHAQNIPASLTTPDRVESRLGALNFKDGIPDKATAQKLFDELDYVHAVEAVMRRLCSRQPTRALIRDSGQPGSTTTTSSVTPSLMDSKSLFLTANADTYYFWTYLDLAKGPLVIERAPETLGIFDDMYWKWVGDFGFPGPDRGKGENT